MKRVVLGAIAATAALSAWAAPASADPTCTYNGGLEEVDVALDAMPASAKVTIQRAGNEIQIVDATPVVIDCGTATVTNTDTVMVTDPAGGHDATVAINEQNGEFTPGANTPPDLGSPEIFFNISFGGVGGGTNDKLDIDGTDNADNILLGESPAGVMGANLNAGETVQDPDLTADGVEQVDVNGRKGDDQVSAVGNAAVPGVQNPLTLGDGLLLLEGGNQNDVLRGGAGADKLDGGTQDDDLNGGGGNDSLDGSADNDSLDGGVGADNMVGNTGTDFVTYGDQLGAVNVSLDDVPNDGGTPDSFGDNAHSDIENVKGGSGADNIIGSVLNNELTGNAGNDTVDGSAGNDKVSGSGGDDRLLGGLGNDNIFGGDGRDNQVGASGNDKITGNAGVDIFLGKKGLDRLFARDGLRDKKIDCGPGANKHESFTRDAKDPKPKSC